MVDLDESYTATSRIDLQIDLTNIAYGIQDGSTQFLFGAGMSHDCGLPTSVELTKILLSEFYFKVWGMDTPKNENEWERLISLFPFEILVEAMGEDREVLTKILRRELIENPDKTNKIRDEENAYSLFSQIINKAKHTSILTTNFDLLFERRIGEHRSVTIDDTTNFYEVDNLRFEGKIPVIHIHGTLTPPSKYIITETDIFDDTYRNIRAEFINRLYSAKYFVFVGYSMNDPDIKAVFRKFLTNVYERGNNTYKRTFVIYPPEGINHKDYVSEKVWKTRKITWIRMGARDFFKKIKDILEYTDLGEIRQEIMKKYKLNNEEELNKKIKKVQEIMKTTESDAIGFLKEADNE